MQSTNISCSCHLGRTLKIGWLHSKLYCNKILVVKTQTFQSPSKNRCLPTIVTAAFCDCSQSGSVKSYTSLNPRD
jgi:hypothetical protein